MDKMDFKKLIEEGRSLASGEVAVLESCLATAQNGKYAKMLITDGVTEMVANRWSYNGEVPEVGSVIHILGNLEEYKGSKNLRVDTWGEGSTRIEEFVKKGPNDLDEVIKKLNSIVDSIENDQMYTFVNKLFQDNLAKIREIPAGKKIHHNYLGGLAQHTLEVTELAIANTTILNNTAKLNLNLDLVKAGAILHDIGKCNGYLFKGINIDMTDEGKLIEHLAIGIVMLHRTLDKLGWTAEGFKEFELVEHIVASHHENLDWGSIVKPGIPEALVVAMSDNMSAKVPSMCSEIDEQKSDWSDKKSFLFGTYLYKR